MRAVAVALIAVTVTVAGLAVVLAWHRGRFREPEPPENVRITTRDGIDIPVQCVYLGRIDGIHQWQIIRPPTVTDTYQVAHVKVGVFPPRTAIAMFDPRGDT